MTTDIQASGFDQTINLKLNRIRTDGGTQPRAMIDWNVVAEYVALLEDGVVFPPVDVFHDGENYWLADGYHRMAAAGKVGQKEIAAVVHQGDRRAAILHSVGANATHGLRRSNADKRRAVETLLRDPEWSQWSDREIARRCNVDHKTVARLRSEYLGNSPDSTRLAQRGGTTYEQRVSSEARSEAASPIPDWTAVRDLETRVLALLTAREGGLRYDELRDQLAVSTPQDKTNLRTALDALLGSQRIVKKGAVYSVPEPPTETSQDAARLLRLLGEMGETTFKPLRDRSGLENSRFWRAFNLLEADGKIVRHASKGGQFPTVSLATPLASEPTPGESAQTAQEPTAAPEPAETAPTDERGAITETVLEVFADAQGSLAYGDVLRAVNELLGREVDVKLFGEVITSLLHGPLRRDATMRLWRVKSDETPVPDAPPEPAPVTDRAAILQHDRAQAAAAEAQNGAAWQTAQTRARLEAALCDVVDGLSAASQVRDIRSFAEVFSAEDMVATRNLIVSALAAFDKTRPHLEDLVGKLDTMIETGKPYED